MEREKLVFWRDANASAIGRIPPLRRFPGERYAKSARHRELGLMAVCGARSSSLSMFSTSCAAVKRNFI
jgi:hypothetical protein